MSEKLREEFLSVREATVDNMQRHWRMAWLDHWIDQGDISLSQIGTTEQEFAQVRAACINDYENDELIHMPVNAAVA